MIIIRSLIFNILFLLLSTIIALFLFPFLISRSATLIIASYWAKTILFLLKIICGVVIKINEKEKIKTKGVIFAIRHESILDTILFLAYNLDIKYIVKKELLYIPFYGLFVWRSGHIIIDRKGKSKTLLKMVSKVKDYLSLGLNVIIFPHGTRVESGKNNRIKSGIYAFYKYLDKPIIPVYLCTGKVWNRNGFIKHPGIIEVKFLKKINKGLSKNEFLSIINDNLN